MKVFLFPFIIVTLFSCSEMNISCEQLKNNYLSVVSRIKTSKDSIEFVRQLQALTMKDSFCIKGKELLAEYYLNNGQEHDAVALYQSNVRIDSNALVSCYNLAEILRIREDYTGALKLLQRAIFVKEVKQGTADFNNFFVVDFDVKYTDLLLSRGRVLYELNSLDSAFKDFSSVLNRGYEEELCRVYIHLIKKKESSQIKMGK